MLQQLFNLAEQVSGLKAALEHRLALLVFAADNVELKLLYVLKGVVRVKVALVDLCFLHLI